MGDEIIEKYLITKVNKDIEELEQAHEPLLAKLLSNLPYTFKELKKSLEQPTTSTDSNPTKFNREKLYNLRNILTEMQMQNKKKTHGIESVLFYKFARSLDKIKGELRQKDNNPIQANEVNSAESETEAFRLSTLSVDETKVHGLDDKAMSMQRLLVPSNNNNDDVRKETVKRILAYLGVQEEIINSANESHGLKGLLFALRLQLMGKRYLIVLDDVWNTEDQYKNFCTTISDDEKCSERLAYGLPKGFGGTVIVTSRTEELAKGMVGKENLHRILPLSDPESCWKIFKDTVDRDGEEFPGQLECLKDKIVEKCAGLLLAAKMMGKITHDELLLGKQRVVESEQEESPQELELPIN
ncbi:putative disease resistance protein [Camellia lanceoleosa]|uniref:Disease resistance protein n=1 Tax=Camellia lanceoleosa TaxID=1840588 RepID=A0ACC0GJ85_9ERIC|nr:putative disease resistance protein [Camellia lanceoleosa]